MKNYKTKTICTALLALILCILLFCLCVILPKYLPTDRYQEYRCYDWHLKAVNTKGKKGTGSTRTESNRLVSFNYQKIDYGKAEEFINASVTVGLSQSNSKKDLVLQSPDCQISLIEDWTIKEMQIYTYDPYSNETYSKVNNEDRGVEILNTTDNKELIKAFLSCVLQGENSTLFDSKVYETYQTVHRIKKICIRLVFSESNNIVWEAPIMIKESSNQDKDSLIVIDIGRTVDGEYEFEHKEVIIEENDAMYSFISEAINLV